MLLTCGNSIKIYELMDKKLIFEYRIDTNSSIISADLHPNQKNLFFSCDGDSNVYNFDFFTKNLSKFRVDGINFITHISIFETGKILAVSGYCRDNKHDKDVNLILTFDIDDQLRLSIRGMVKAHKNLITSVLFLPDQHLVGADASAKISYSELEVKSSIKKHDTKMFPKWSSKHLNNINAMIYNEEINSLILSDNEIVVKFRYSPNGKESGSQLLQKLKIFDDNENGGILCLFNSPDTDKYMFVGTASDIRQFDVYENLLVGIIPVDGCITAINAKSAVEFSYIKDSEIVCHFFEGESTVVYESDSPVYKLFMLKKESEAFFNSSAVHLKPIIKNLKKAVDTSEVSNEVQLIDGTNIKRSNKVPKSVRILNTDASQAGESNSTKKMSSHTDTSTEEQAQSNNITPLYRHHTSDETGVIPASKNTESPIPNQDGCGKDNASSINEDEVQKDSYSSKNTVPVNDDPSLGQENLILTTEDSVSSKKNSTSTFDDPKSHIKNDTDNSSTSISNNEKYKYPSFMKKDLPFSRKRLINKSNEVNLDDGGMHSVSKPSESDNDNVSEQIFPASRESNISGSKKSMKYSSKDSCSIDDHSSSVQKDSHSSNQPEVHKERSNSVKLVNTVLSSQREVLMDAEEVSSTPKSEMNVSQTSEKNVLDKELLSVIEDPQNSITHSEKLTSEKSSYSRLKNLIDEHKESISELRKVSDINNLNGLTTNIDFQYKQLRRTGSESSTSSSKKLNKLDEIVENSDVSDVYNTSTQNTEPKANEFESSPGVSKIQVISSTKEQSDTKDQKLPDFSPIRRVQSPIAKDQVSFDGEFISSSSFDEDTADLKNIDNLQFVKMFQEFFQVQFERFVLHLNQIYLDLLCRIQNLEEKIARIEKYLEQK